MSTVREAALRIVLVMPVRDCEQYVGEAIESVLTQSAPPGEIVVVDDGSVDGTRAVLAGFGDAIRVLEHTGTGQFAALNQGIAESDLPFLAFLDADDLFTPESLAVRVDRLEASDTPDAVVGRTEQFVSPELGPDAAARFRFDEGPVDGELFQTTLLRRTAFERVGPLRTDLATSANIEWVSRSRSVGIRSVRVAEVVARRRLHTSNVGITRGEEKKQDLLDVVRAHRRRQQPPDPS